MGKWSNFRMSDERIPTTHYEAAVFLDNAVKHLRNRTDGPLGESCWIILRAHEEVRKCLIAGITA